MEKIEIRNIKIPQQLAPGFLDFAKEVERQSKELNTKFSIEELTEIFNNSFSGKVRAEFILHVGDINHIIDGIIIVYGDLSDLRQNKYFFKGDPIIRSELLFQCFFNEFFRIRETSKIFMKYLQDIDILTKKAKQEFVDSYFKLFDFMYDIRNSFIHKGMKFKEDGESISFDIDFFKTLSSSEKKKFISLVNESNTRENTIEIQCALYMKTINHIMKIYINFQEMLHSLFADFIVLYEKKVLKITVENNDITKSV